MASSPDADAEYEWFPARLLQRTPREAAPPLAIVVLNQPLDGVQVLPRVFPKSIFTVAADGGADRLLELPNGRALGLHNVDAIVGDLDSVSPAAVRYFETLDAAADAGLGPVKTTRIVRDDDQYSTDFTKAVKYVRQRHPLVDVVALGGLGGRFDQALSQLHHLYLFDEPRDSAHGRYRIDWGLGSDSANDAMPAGRTFLLSGDSLAFLLRPGRHTIHVREPGRDGAPTEEVFAKHVGLLPLQGPSVISTRGLEWDVQDWPTEFGGQVSTSNHVLPATQAVEVTTDRAVVFTIALHESWRSG